VTEVFERLGIDATPLVAVVTPNQPHYSIRKKIGSMANEIIRIREDTLHHITSRSTHEKYKEQVCAENDEKERLIYEAMRGLSEFIVEPLIDGWFRIVDREGEDLSGLIQIIGENYQAFCIRCENRAVSQFPKTTMWHGSGYYLVNDEDYTIIQDYLRLKKAKRSAEVLEFKIAEREFLGTLRGKTKPKAKKYEKAYKPDRKALSLALLRRQLIANEEGLKTLGFDKLNLETL
jgi:hypothetical protein